MSIWTRFLGCSSAVEPRPDKPVVIGSNPIAPTISRRAFFGGAAAVAVAAPSITRAFFGPPRGGWPVADFTTDGLRYKAYERYSAGWTDPKAIYGTSFGCEPCKPMTAAEFRKAVEPGLRKVFEEVYDNRCAEWERIYNEGDGVSLNSAPHPDSPILTEEDHRFIDDGGWKCVNGHPYCNRCVSSLDLNEESLERMLIDVKKEVDRTGKRISLDPRHAWYLNPETDQKLRTFERRAPIRISPGRRWWK